MTDQHQDPGSRSLSAEDEEALARLTRAPRRAAAEPDAALRDTLLDAVESGRLRLDIERRVIAHPHSPVSVSALETQFALGGAVVAIVTFIFLGWQIGTGLIVAMVAFYWLFLRGWLNRRMNRLAIRAFRDNVETWRKTWAFGGVRLTPTAGGEACIAPDGSWRSLAETIGSK
ncbi:MAG: hypothetical protein ACT7A5_15665 [Ferrovibrionaceae bacterium]